MRSEINSVGALTEYYETLKARQAQGEALDNSAGELPLWELIDALCRGDFDPADARDYPDKERWQDSHLFLPATEQGASAPEFDSMKVL